MEKSEQPKGNRTKGAKRPSGAAAKLSPGSMSGDPWSDRPHDVRQFLEQRPRYEQLCSEVAYILGKQLGAQGIKSFSVTNRAKELGSFLEKIQRKTYTDPFADITDFAGARVVCYYPDDLPKIRQIIRTNFEVIEEASKGKDKKPDQFGYLADHYIVRLGAKTAGARYDDLKDLKCEIQVRTVLQDAWAVFSHHLLYKRESEMPDDLKRRINALAGVFETADLSFQEIRDKRDQFFKDVKAASTDEQDSLPTNLDSLQVFLPTITLGVPVASVNEEEESRRIRWAMRDTGLLKTYPLLGDVRSLIQRTQKARAQARTSWDYFDPHSPGSELLLAGLLDAPPTSIRAMAKDVANELRRDYGSLVEPK